MSRRRLSSKPCMNLISAIEKGAGDSESISGDGATARGVDLRMAGFSNRKIELISSSHCDIGRGQALVGTWRGLQGLDDDFRRMLLYHSRFEALTLDYLGVQHRGPLHPQLPPKENEGGKEASLLDIDDALFFETLVLLSTRFNMIACPGSQDQMKMERKSLSRLRSQLQGCTTFPPPSTPLKLIQKRNMWQARPYSLSSTRSLLHSCSKRLVVITVFFDLPQAMSAC